MLFPIVIHKDKDSDFGITLPDIPGCFTASSNIEDALAMAVEAAGCHLEGLLLDGEVIPEAMPIEEHRENPDYADAYTWALIRVDLSKFSGKTQRINITITDLILRQVDYHAKKNNMSRSGFLSEAAIKAIQCSR